MTQTKALKFALVGTGAIAAHHMASIEELESCQLVAVCSSSKQRAAAAAERFGVPAYAELSELLAREEVDVVSVCTASGNHLEPAVTAARAGKHVLLEKPIEVSLERADELISTCRSQGVKLGVIFQNRFTPGFQRLKAAVKEGMLGRILMGNAYIKWFRDPAYYSNSSWKGTLKGDGGAALINQGIHTIDLLLDLMPEVEQVFGQVRTLLHAIEGEDVGLALLNFKGGALGTIEAATALYPGYPERLEVYGEKGSVILEGGVLVQWNVQGHEQALPLQETPKTGTADPMAVDYRLHKAQIQDMVEAILHDRDPRVTGVAAKKSLALIQAIYRSSRENRPVLL